METFDKVLIMILALTAVIVLYVFSSIYQDIARCNERGGFYTSGACFKMDAIIKVD